jgi:hypothetical protein
LLEMPGDYVSPLPLLGCCNKDTPWQDSLHLVKTQKWEVQTW